MQQSNADAPRPRRRWIGRALFALLGLIVVGVPVVFLVGYVLLRGSLPALEGRVPVTGLEEEVKLLRDRQGMVRIEAASRADALFALGFAHAQDRFFQMDLLRRNAAGELSALFGEATVSFDKRRRLHRMRTRAQAVLNELDRRERRAVTSYALGVNAGLQSLKRRPYPYFMIRQQTERWLPEDSLLAGYAMFFDLQDEEARDEENRAFARQHLTSEVFAFLFGNGFVHSVPMVGEALPVNPPPPKEFWPAPAKEPLAALSALPSEAIPGSNAWAAAGNRTRSGIAQVAVDMHLGLRVPNTWYRAQLTYPGEEGPVTVTGVTLPGAPGVIVGSNGKVAWGFTNAGADMSDLVRLETDPEKPGMYRTADGWKAFSETEERIRVRGEDPVRHPVRETIFGPVRENRFGEGLWAVQWIGHHPEYFNLHHLRLAEAVSIEEATAIARRAGIPLQNFVVADEHGDIAWTFMGGMPDRGNRPAELPVGSHHPQAKWLGRLAPEEVPRLVNPPSGLIWTANNPVYRGAGADRLLGEESYADDGRARVILEALEKQNTPFAEEDFLAIQLSDRSQLHDRWQERILAALTGEWIGDNPRRAAFREALRTWDGHATVDSTAFPLLRLVRSHIAGEVYPRLLPKLFPEEGQQLQINSFRWDEPLYQLVTAGDPALCGPDSDWDGLIRAAVEKVLAELRNYGSTPGELNHGELNRLRVQHPLSRALPLLGRWLDMPTVELPGYSTTPRAQKPAFGASQRMVVRPGREDTAIFHMPTGQSGHVLSPFYRAGHENWVQGLPSPLLPGPATHRLLLLPLD